MLDRTETIVIGHRNPDMDSICAALAYARLKILTGMQNVVAGRAGNTNERIDFVLEKFGVEAPVFFHDVSPRVADVMETDVISISADATVYDAVQLTEKNRLRGLPVVDAAGRCLGMLSTFKVNHYLFPPRDEAGAARRVTASMSDIVESFGGSVLGGEIETVTRDFILVVAAMERESFARRVEKLAALNTILFVGDRETIHLHAIAGKMSAIIITGGLLPTDRVRAAAREAGVPLISSPLDTASSVLLARGAVKAERMLSPDLKSFGPETPLSHAREVAATSAVSVFPILDDQGVLVGILSKSDFISPIRRQLILVDHNELSQAVPGAGAIPIIEVLDHHRLGGFSTDSPIHFMNSPVGATSTIVALCYEQENVPVPPEIAGLLMAGIISDTLNLTSPTTTTTDARFLKQLSALAGVEAAALAEQIFSVGSPLLTMAPEQVVTADCKEYSEGGLRFTISQVEEMNSGRFYEREPRLAEALADHRARNGLYFSALFVTDVNTQDSLFLVSAPKDFIEKIDFPHMHDGLWHLPGIVSRKKQLLPRLLQLLKS